MAAIWFHGSTDEEFAVDPDRELWLTDSRELAALYGDVHEVLVELEGRRVLEIPMGGELGARRALPADVAEEVGWLLGEQAGGEYSKDALVDLVAESGLYEAVALGYIPDDPAVTGGGDRPRAGGHVIVMLPGGLGA